VGQERKQTSRFPQLRTKFQCWTNAWWQQHSSDWKVGTIRRAVAKCYDNANAISAAVGSGSGPVSDLRGDYTFTGCNGDRETRDHVINMDELTLTFNIPMGRSKKSGRSCMINMFLLVTSCSVQKVHQGHVSQYLKFQGMLEFVGRQLVASSMYDLFTATHQRKTTCLFSCTAATQLT